MRYWLPLLAGILICFSSCRNPAPEEWTDLVPEKTPFLVLPENGQSLRELLNAPYMPLLEDVTPAAIQLTGDLLEVPSQSLPVTAMLLYPDTSNDLQPVFIGDLNDGFARALIQAFQEPYTQRNYQFGDETIQILRISERQFYLLEYGPYAILSESSLAIEDMIRTWRGDMTAIRLDPDQLQRGSYILNTPSLDRWVEQLADIGYRPALRGLFQGTSPVTLRPGDSEQPEHLSWMLEGHIGLENEKSALIHAVSGTARSFLLDRYIPSNASGFSIFFLESRSLPTADPVSDLDRQLSDDRDLFKEISSTLHPELAFAAFTETGFMSTSEYVILRRLENPQRLRTLLAGLADEGLIQETDQNLYHASSTLLGELLGSELSSLTGFYLGVHDDALILSRNNSLIVGVRSDHNRRRVFYYESSYTDIRNQFNEELSSFTYLNGPSFNSFIQPWLFPQNYAATLGSSLEILTITTRRESEQDPLNLRIANHTHETTQAPYTERWTYPLQSDLTGPPVLANIMGSSRDEIIFTSENGMVHVLAADGSPVMQTDTAGDRPIGPPVIYDWYGNNQQIILQAAANKVYAWNETGTLLPNFPVILEEEITTPLQITDVTRSGVAEIVVATADRQVHVLNARGNPVSDWPRTTNSTVVSSPLLAELDNQRSLFAFAENGLHAWNTNGVRREGFPLFIESRFNGDPVIHQNHLIGSGADGNLYAVGEQGLFDAELAATNSGDSLVTRSINVSNSGLTNSPVISSELVRVDGEVTREELILVQSSNGALQAYNSEGELRFTESMGQPASESTGPRFIDINGNGRTEVVALASSGRLYAWDLVTGSRIYDLPSSAMSHPLVQDMNRDGNVEIIARTREGIRVWTIFQSE